MHWDLQRSISLAGQAADKSQAIRGLKRIYNLLELCFFWRRSAKRTDVKPEPAPSAKTDTTNSTLSEEALLRVRSRLLKEVEEIELDVYNNITSLDKFNMESRNGSRDSLKMSFLNQTKLEIVGSSYQKVFEVQGDEEYFYVLSQHNQKHNPKNAKNPYYAEVSILRYKQETYLSKKRYDLFGEVGQYYGNPQNGSTDLLQRVHDSHGESCLLDFIPGAVQKLALDQADSSKIVLLYRILGDEGYLLRLRIYDLKNLKCSHLHPNPDLIFHQISTNQEHLFTSSEMNITEPLEPFKFEEDFTLPMHSKISALNFYNGKTITLSYDPDFYEFRVLVKKKDEWVYGLHGPFMYKSQHQQYINTGLHYLKVRDGAADG